MAATMEEVARKAGVSQATVSRVINGNTKVNLETKQLVMDWVRKLGYKPNLAAKTLAGNKSYLIGLSVPDITNPFFAELVRHIELQAAVYGYSIILCNNDGRAQKEKKDIESLRMRQVDGILLAPADASAKHLRSLSEIDLPVIIVTQAIEGFNSVTASLRQGGRLVATHLIERGYKRIGFVGSIDDEKFIGFQEILKKNMIELPQKNIIECREWDQFLAHEVHQKLKSYLHSGADFPFDAIFANNDIAAFSVIMILNDSGIRVPEDVAVAGYDNTYLSIEARPQITTIAQPLREIGMAAVERLLELCEDRDHDINHEIYDPRLIIRRSTGE